jgi:hypothetical protein
MQNRICKYYEPELDDDIIPPRDSDAAYWRERLIVEIELSRVLNRVSFLVGMFFGAGLVVVGFFLFV